MGSTNTPATQSLRATDAPPSALFLGTTYAGHATRFASLQKYVETDPRLASTFRRVTGWKPGGPIEALRFVPRSVRGRTRATLEASAFARLPRPDVIWTSVTEVLTPFLWAQFGPLGRPLVLDIDSTWSQLDAMAEHYAGRQPRSGCLAWQARTRERLLFKRVSHFTPCSRWAARGLEDAGIHPSRITVIYPGVDLSAWGPTGAVAPPSEQLRLLFVGGNFVRKGGDMLLDIMRSSLGANLELDIVTRDPVESGGNVRVHRLEQGSPALHALYCQADLFVMPSRGECFGMATIEAMASGLPALVSNVGASPEIVEDGSTGWLVEPTAAGLARGLRSALQARDCLREMGRRARCVAELRFDASVNHRQTVDVVVNSAMARCL